MPVIPIPMSAPKRCLASSAMATATSALTALMSRDRVRRNSQGYLDAIGLRDHATPEEQLILRHVGETRREQPAAVVLHHRQTQAPGPQQPANRGLQRFVVGAPDVTLQDISESCILAISQQDPGLPSLSPPSLSVEGGSRPVWHRHQAKDCRSGKAENSFHRRSPRCGRTSSTSWPE